MEHNERFQQLVKFVTEANGKVLPWDFFARAVDTSEESQLTDEQRKEFKSTGTFSNFSPAQLEVLQRLKTLAAEAGGEFDLGEWVDDDEYDEDDEDDDDEDEDDDE